MTPPPLFDWLLRKVLPFGPRGDSIRGDLLEELSSAGDGRARWRFRLQVLSIAARYALRSPAPHRRPERRGDLVDTLRQHLAHGVRSLIARPSYTLVVVTTLALGIGANTAIFSILHALVLRSLPVIDPERLVVVLRNEQPSQQYPLFRHFQDHSRTVDVMAFRTSTWRFGEGAQTERVTGALVSGSYFPVLGIQPAIGTPIAPADDVVPGSGGPRGPVAVLGHGFWMRRFGGDAGVIGSRVLLNAQPFTVVGVAPAGFIGTEVGASVDVFAPMMLQQTLMPGLGPALDQPRSQWLRVIARLRPGVDAPQVEAELTALLRPYNEAILRDPAIVKFGGDYPQRVRAQRITVEAGSGGLSGLRTQYAQPLVVVMAVMGLVLLTACANIANLSLTRAAARRKEVAIRMGLGASRGRVVGQLLTESLLLAAAGGAAGLVLARWGRDLLLRYLPTGRTLDAPLDPDVLLFTLAVAGGAALLFGVAPAYQGTRVDVAPALKGSGERGTPPSRWRKGLVAFQVGVSLVVVIGAVLFVRSLDALLSIDTGFARSHVLVASIDMVSERDVDFNARLLAELRATPGVASAALAWSAPLVTNTGWLVYVEGYVPKADEPRTTPWVEGVSPGFFQTMGTPIVLGRDFDDRDVAAEQANVMIVNETFARHYFGDTNPIGRRVGLAPGVFDIEIVAVVKDGKYTGLRERPLRMMYVPQRERVGSSQMTVLVRTTGDPLRFAPTLQRTAVAVDPRAIVYDVATVEQQVGRALLRERLVATISGLFGGLALLIAAVGLYGVLSFGVAQRTREFGIRIAIGAESRSILAMVLREAGWVLALGVAGGLAVAWRLGRLVGTLLYGVEPGDAASTAIAVAVLVGAGLIAAWIPARRAARIDPVRALRYE